MVTLPRHTSPYQSDYRGYISTLKKFNREFQEHVSQFFKEKLDGESLSYSILTTGSDGRYEKGPVSEIELIVLTCIQGNCAAAMDRARITHDELSRLRELVESYPQHLIAQHIEVKDIIRDSMSRYQNDRRRAYPTRIMDSIFLAGVCSFQGEAKRLLVTEFRGKDRASIR